MKILGREITLGRNKNAQTLELEVTEQPLDLHPATVAASVVAKDAIEGLLERAAGLAESFNPDNDSADRFFINIGEAVVEADRDYEEGIRGPMLRAAEQAATAASNPESTALLDLNEEVHSDFLGEAKRRKTVLRDQTKIRDAKQREKEGIHLELTGRSADLPPTKDRGGVKLALSIAIVAFDMLFNMNILSKDAGFWDAIGVSFGIGFVVAILGGRYAILSKMRERYEEAKAFVATLKTNTRLLALPANINRDIRSSLIVMCIFIGGICVYRVFSQPTGATLVTNLVLAGVCYAYVLQARSSASGFPTDKLAKIEDLNGEIAEADALMAEAMPISADKDYIDTKRTDYDAQAGLIERRFNSTSDRNRRIMLWFITLVKEYRTAPKTFRGAFADCVDAFADAVVAKHPALVTAPEFDFGKSERSDAVNALLPELPEQLTDRDLHLEAVQEGLRQIQRLPPRIRSFVSEAQRAWDLAKPEDLPPATAKALPVPTIRPIRLRRPTR